MIESHVLTLGTDVEGIVKLVAVGGGIACAALWIVFTAVKAMVIGKAREDTRREVAAYVAEGSMTPDDAAKIIEAGKKADKGSCWS